VALFVAVRWQGTRTSREVMEFGPGVQLHMHSLAMMSAIWNVQTVRLRRWFKRERQIDETGERDTPVEPCN
jgi:hypothetical protein